MLLVERLGPCRRIAEPVDELPHGGRRQDLLTAQQAFRPSLGVASLKMRCLVIEVQDEPQLDAGVRYDHADPVGLRLVERLGHIGVLIDIEHAPDLVMGAAAPPALIPGIAPLCLDRSIDE